jgi:hypothetical protein
VFSFTHHHPDKAEASAFSGDRGRYTGFETHVRHSQALVMAQKWTRVPVAV